jgi:hypothetical protein
MHNDDNSEHMWLSDKALAGQTPAVSRGYIWTQPCFLPNLLFLFPPPHFDPQSQILGPIFFFSNSLIPGSTNLFAMVDPGTAVGVISLGLQVLQGLTQFYTRFASYSADITAVVRRIESLCLILEALERPVRKLERDEPISAAVRQCIESFKAGLRELTTYQRKCGDISLVPTATEDKIRLVRMRVLFPFRKATLDEVGKVVDRLQLNVDTIMQALQL